MTRLISVAVAVVCLFVTSYAIAAKSAADERIKETDACGYVVDSTGAVVAQATVTASSGGRTIATAGTLSDGSFHFEDSIGSGVDLMVQAPGFAAATAQVGRVIAVKSEKKCKRPLYVVLTRGSGASFITNKKNQVPRLR